MSLQGIGSASGKGLSNVFMQLRKVCNHPYLFFDDRWPSDLVSPRCVSALLS